MEFLGLKGDIQRQIRVVKVIYSNEADMAVNTNGKMGIWNRVGHGLSIENGVDSVTLRYEDDGTTHIYRK